MKYCFCGFTWIILSLCSPIFHKVLFNKIITYSTEYYKYKVSSWHRSKARRMTIYLNKVSEFGRQTITNLYKTYIQRYVLHSKWGWMCKIEFIGNQKNLNNLLPHVHMNLCSFSITGYLIGYIFVRFLCRIYSD